MKDISCFGEPKINYPCMWEYKAFVSVGCDENWYGRAINRAWFWSIRLLLVWVAMKRPFLMSF